MAQKLYNTKFVVVNMTKIVATIANYMPIA
jgi:hypothetical protein